jgi:penicillin-binding protein 1B
MPGDLASFASSIARGSPAYMTTQKASGKKGRMRRFVGWLAKDPLLRGALSFVVLATVVGLGIFSYFYIKYDRMIEQRFRGPLFSNAARIYAQPRTLHTGERTGAKEIASQLRRAGYSEGGADAPMGTFRLLSGGIEVQPGPQSYHAPEKATIRIHDGVIESIAGPSGELSAYELEPVAVTSLFESGQRAKRQLIHYQDIPKVLIDAVLAIEDRRFFQHSGVNYLRLVEAAWIDITHTGHRQGGSTITMQLSRAFLLTPEKTVKRKLAEMQIALILEQKFSKEQIFELYANRVDLGQRGSFTISGFAEGAHAYFNKDLKDLTIADAALIAGLIQAPSALSPYRHPDRALERRNLVIESMVETHAITREDADKAKATPLRIAPPNVESSDAPYFVDMVRDTLLAKFSEHDLNDEALRVYTTIDPDLQRGAAAAVEEGIKITDDQVKAQRSRRVKVGKKVETQVASGPQAQVALVALDPHTGEVLALVGGRNYGLSQLNHALAKRPTGSIFKPFVYAAAMNNAISGAEPIFTPVSLIDDSPTTFSYGDQIYEPRNYKEEYHGQVTIRYALAMSLNNATVKLAEAVGYDKVADLAKAAGIASVHATPAMALGSYDATPVDMAGAYTVFANGGVKVSPTMIASVRNATGDVLQNYSVTRTTVLDPRVVAVMTNMLEGVMNNGTAAGVRARGFTLPAAGKTGSSHDGWFAGYTNNLLCIVWVGYDDYSDLRLSGAQTAAPIWAEFMKRATALPRYQNATPFGQPDGVVNLQLDKATNRIATPACQDTFNAVFIAGTEPKESCDGGTGFLSAIFGGHSDASAPNGATTYSPPDPAAAAKKKKSFLGRVFGVFKDDKNAAPASNKNKQSSPGTPPH